MTKEELILNENKKVNKSAKAALIGIISIIAIVVTMFGFGTTATAATCSHSYAISTITAATTSSDGTYGYVCKYCGKVKSTTTVAKIDTVTLSATSYTYNGEAKVPTVKVTDSNGKTISTTYYTVSYIDRSTGKTTTSMKNVGKYYVVVTFSDRYSGTIKKTVTIKPKKASFSSAYGVSSGIQLKWAKKAAGTTAYQIQYSTSSDFSGATTITIKDTSTTSRKITGLTAAKKYYVRIRTYTSVTVDGETTKLYSSWSTSKSVITSPKATTLKSVSYSSTGKIKVSWAKQSNATGYIVQYSTSSSFSTYKTSTVLVSSNSTTSKTISGLAAKKYYVRIATYKTVNGKKYVSDWSSSKSVTVKSGASIKTALNAISTKTTNKKQILSLTNNGVNIANYSTTYARVKAIYDWHAKHYTDLGSCAATNKNFCDCISLLFEDTKEYDTFITLQEGYYKNNNGSTAHHFWAVIYINGVGYIFDPRMQGYNSSYDSTGLRFFGITSSSTYGKKYTKDGATYVWDSEKTITNNICVVNSSSRVLDTVSKYNITLL